MVVGSRARDLVESYPMTEGNYPKVISALEERFGKPKLLKQVYVRELLTIIIHNTRSNEVNLAKMYDSLESHLRALETLGVTPEQTAEFVFPMVESSLPEDILIAWQRSAMYGVDGSTENPPSTELQHLMTFLRQEVEREGQRSIVRAGFESNPANKEKSREKSRAASRKEKDGFATTAGLFSGGNAKKCCVFCDRSNHNSPDCYKAQMMTLQQKKDKVKEKKCCFVCLRQGHLSKDCKSSAKCVICSRKHLVIMCPDLEKRNDSGGSGNRNDGENSAAMSHHQCKGDVLLQTVLVRLYNDDGSDYRVVRLLFDSGSQGTSVRADVADELNLQKTGQVWSRKVLYGGSVTNKQKHNKFNIKLASVDGKVRRNLTALDEQDICGQLRRVPTGPWLKELANKNIWMSDFISDSEEIQVLVGSDYYGQLMTGRIVHLKCGLTAMESVCGWTLSGSIPAEDSLSLMSVSTALVNCNSIQDLWNLEALGIRDSGEVKSKSEREVATQEHFQETVTRNDEGRYSVLLPWVEEGQPIPSNRLVAEKRLESTTRKLKQTGNFESYIQIFQEWLKEGFIEIVQNPNQDENSHDLPHRAVFKPESLTTPVRPVFDASCKIGRSPSLNDCLEKGPNLLELIPALLVRFREKKVGVISDVRKAFQMIEVEESDRDFLRFLWWEENEDSKIQVFRHKRVVFGVNSSPFLLGAVLEKHLKEVSGPHESIAKKLLKSLYVDNCVTSVNSEEEYQNFKQISTHLLADAKMELRQWECSAVEGSGVGYPAIRECGLEPDGSYTHQELSSVLGMKWQKVEDKLQVDIPYEQLPEKITKRVILSMVQKLFDPLGFLAPTTLIPKLILQQTWEKKSSWDDELSAEMKKEFISWWSTVQELKKVHIPRHAFGIAVVQPEEIQFHCFGDAPKKAYSAAIFVRVQHGDEISVQLLQAKSRVAPLKSLTIPRLELMASVITTRLASSVKSALSMEAATTYFWTDSSTALAWIRRNNEWGTFVGNRVKEICSSSLVSQWNFVPGKMNPADLPSRGCSPSQLLSCCWWEGPDWLRKSAEHWPTHFEPEADEDLVTSEKKKSTIARMEAVEVENPWYVTRYSSYTKNLRLLGWILRFLQKCKKISPSQTDSNIVIIKSG